MYEGFEEEQYASHTLLAGIINGLRSENPIKIPIPASLKRKRQANKPITTPEQIKEEIAMARGLFSQMFPIVRG